MTRVTIQGEDFLIDGQPTYAGRTWRGHRVEGLLLNSRMVQAIFDDLNPQTREHWAYPDTGVWDPERNVSEFLAMLPTYPPTWPSRRDRQPPGRLAGGVQPGATVG